MGPRRTFGAWGSLYIYYYGANLHLTTRYTLLDAAMGEEIQYLRGDDGFFLPPTGTADIAHFSFVVFRPPNNGKKTLCPVLVSQNLKLLVRKIKYQHVVFDGSEWIVMSDEAKNFLKRLLVKVCAVDITKWEGEQARRVRQMRISVLSRAPKWG